MGGWGPKPPFPEELADKRRPLKKTASADANKQTNRQTDIATQKAQKADSVKILVNK